MKHLLIFLVILFAALGVILYFNMFHFACVLSFLFSLLAGYFLSRYQSNRYKASLDKQEEIRKQLSADVAHELRTPLTSIGTHLEAMIEGIWEPSKERLENCRDEVLRLGSLVKDLDRLAQADSENLQLNLSSVDLFETMKALLPAWETQTNERGITLTVSGSPSVVRADKDKLLQVITNLLSNAVKYTPENGHIAVHVFSDGKNGIIEVADDGAGISESDLPYIFERFYRADRSRTRTTGGAGIGLAIVQSIIAAHGGTVTAESENGKGSTFTVTLPTG